MSDTSRDERTLVEQSRDEFVNWVRASGQFTDWSRAPDWSELKGIYLKPRVRLSWEVWCASRDQAAAEITRLTEQVEMLTKERNENAAEFDQLVGALEDRMAESERRIAEVRAEEREACAKIADMYINKMDHHYGTAICIASAIRAQSDAQDVKEG